MDGNFSGILTRLLETSELKSLVILIDFVSVYELMRFGVEVECSNSRVEKVVATTGVAIIRNIMSFLNYSLRIVEMFQLGLALRKTFKQDN